MVLEKIIRFAKIATTNTELYVVPLVAGIGIASALADGKVDENDIIPFVFTGVTLAIGAVAARKEQYEFNRIASYCEQYGFDQWFLRNPVDRRKVKIYAEESGRLNQFEQALKEYRL
ncbi:MAG: hypothetical protein Q8R47_02250 [Nanoarchaeota archaeon]|nr:hypothetical protein [Nanoarchaeota archaeon]